MFKKNFVMILILSFITSCSNNEVVNDIPKLNDVGVNNVSEVSIEDNWVIETWTVDLWFIETWDESEFCWPSSEVCAVDFWITETWVIDKDNNEMTEEEFLDSGSSKAIENETDLWNLYEDKEVWFYLNYPLNAVILWEDDWEINDDKFSYKISTKEIWIGDNIPMSLSKEQEAETIAGLASWKFWKNSDFVFEESKKVIPVANIFAQDYLVLWRFEVCNVTLEKALVFYYNNKEIKIKSSFPKDKLKELMPEYFITDETNCFEEKIWNFDKQSDFYNTLLNNEAPEKIQNWFNDFNKISDTIIFHN